MENKNLSKELDDMWTELIDLSKTVEEHVLWEFRYLAEVKAKMDELSKRFSSIVPFVQDKTSEEGRHGIPPQA